MNNIAINVDLLLLNARIIGGINEKRELNAVAVKNGRILAVGTADELNGLNAKHRIQLNNKRTVAQIEFYLLTPPHLVRQIFGFFLKYFYKRTNSN